MICANCGKPMTDKVSNVYNYVRYVHLSGTYFCYNVGPQRASLPIIIEAFVPGDEHIASRDENSNTSSRDMRTSRNT
jgi:hypothetical protein